MVRPRLAALLPAMMFVCLAAACGGTAGNSTPRSNAPNSSQPPENVNAAKSNIEELGMLVNIPYEAEDIVWKENAGHDRLVAVLRFSSDDAAKIISEAATYGTAQHVTVSSETWVPAELIAQGDMTGDDSLHGMAYPANAFYQEPYTVGRIVRIDGTDYFVLELSKK
jgi:hypothetical protein